MRIGANARAGHHRRSGVVVIRSSRAHIISPGAKWPPIRAIVARPLTVGSLAPSEGQHHGFRPSRDYQERSQSFLTPGVKTRAARARNRRRAFRRTSLSRRASAARPSLWTALPSVARPAILCEAEDGAPRPTFHLSLLRSFGGQVRAPALRARLGGPDLRVASQPSLTLRWQA